MSNEQAEIMSVLNNLPIEAVKAIRDYALATQKAYDRIKMQSYLASIPEDDEELSEAEKALLNERANEKGGISLEALEKELGL